jgi:hypothetical protein
VAEVVVGVEGEEEEVDTAEEGVNIILHTLL